MRERIRYIVAVSTALLLTAALSAQGQQTQKPSPSTSSQQQSSQQPKGGSLSGTDRNFLMTAGHGGHAEVMLAQMAQKKAMNSEVKALAERLDKDHSANNKELETLASSKGVTVPMEMDAQHKQVQARLDKLDGAAFDKAYASEMVNGHKKMIALFEQASKSKDADISGFAQKTLPTLKEHLSLAQKAAASAGATSSTSGTSKPATSKPDTSRPGTTPGATTPGTTPK
jgi:putative membrane protein